MRRRLLVAAAFLALLACATQASFTVQNSDPEALKGSPAGVSTFGFLDVMATVPQLLGGAAPACVTAADHGTTRTLTLAGCPSSTGGTLAGTVPVDLSGAPAALVETFNGVVTTRRPGLTWTLAGRLDLDVDGAAATLNPEPGFTLTVVDAAVPAMAKVWSFAGALTALTSATGFTLQGAYTFTAGTTDAVLVSIDDQHPLVWLQGGAYPVSGQLVVLDNRLDRPDPEKLTAVFDHGTVTINGGKITLPQ